MATLYVQFITKNTGPHHRPHGGNHGLVGDISMVKCGKVDKSFHGPPRII